MCKKCIETIEREDEEKTCYNCDNTRIYKCVDYRNYCYECYKLEFFSTCENCSRQTLTDHMLFQDDGIYCYVCYNSLFFTCDSCGDVFRGDGELYTIDSNHYCNDCYDNNTSCCDYCHRDYLSELDECPYCDDGEENLVGVFSYSYKPKPLYRDKKQNNSYNGQIYLGIELEHQLGDLTSREVTEKAHDIFDNYVYYKSDGSLINGIELVTHPATMDSIPFDKFRKYLKWLSDNKAKSWQAEGCSCGLHIHVSKEPYLSPSRIGKFKAKDLFLTKLCYFMSKFSESWFKISGRKESHYEQYCKIEKLNIKQITNHKTFLSRGSTSHLENWFSHYSGVNLSNSQTIEFRFFRGTLDYESFCSSVKMPFYICNFVKDRGLGYFHNKALFQDFIDYLPDNLQNFISSRLNMPKRRRRNSEGVLTPLTIGEI